MKHFTTALLTLALFTGLSAGKSSAQGFRPVPSPVVWLADDPVDEIGSSNFDIGCNQVTCYPEIDITNFTGDIDGLIAIIAIACLRGEKVSIKDVDCPQLGGQEGEDIVDLWFELVDAGYTEDEAFDLIELVMGDDNALSFEGESVNTLTSYEGKLPIAEPLPVNNIQLGYISNTRSKKRTHWIEPQGHILW